MTTTVADAPPATLAPETETLTDIGIRAVRALGRFLLPAVPVLGLIVYGVLRQLYALFYGSLGASPEEVGLGYSEILALSALGVVWISVLALPVLVAFAVFGARDQMHRAHYLLCNFPWLSTAGAGVGSVIIGLIEFFVIAPPGRQQYLAVLIGLGALLLFLSFLLNQASRVPRHRPVLGAALFVLYAVYLGTAILWGVSQRAATDAYNGLAVRSVNIAGVQVLGLRAEPSIVTWKGATPAAMAYLSQRCLMYLGESNDSVVLFDPGPPYVRTLRLQKSDVLVTVIRGGDIGTRSTGNVRCKNPPAPAQPPYPGVVLQP